MGTGQRPCKEHEPVFLPEGVCKRRLLLEEIGNTEAPSSDEKLTEFRWDRFNFRGSSGQVDAQNTVSVRCHCIPPLKAVYDLASSYDGLDKCFFIFKIPIEIMLHKTILMKTIVTTIASPAQHPIAKEKPTRRPEINTKRPRNR
jgi:hypothetical protein